MKQEYTIFANKSTKLKAIAKKNYYADELEKTKEIREKHGSCLGRYSPQNFRNHPIFPLQYA